MAGLATRGGEARDGAARGGELRGKYISPFLVSVREQSEGIDTLENLFPCECEILIKIKNV